MENMTLEQIAKACGGRFVGEETEKGREAAGVVLDSRLLREGDCFIAVKGERVDGHDFIQTVLEQGACCAICEAVPKGCAGKGNLILVKDSLQALKDLAEYYRSTLKIPVIGITGSVGKTSTKEYIAGVLSRRYRVLKTEGNFNNEIGVPLTLLRIRREHEIAVLEMGINHFGEMRRLSKMVRPDVCVMTNIGLCHLEFLGSRRGILEAKSEIFEYLAQDGTVYLNGDDDMLQTIEAVNGRKPVSFGMGEKNDYYADEIENRGLLGSSIRIHSPSGSFKAQLCLPGEHMIRNALAAAAVGTQYGLTEEEISEGLVAVGPVNGRSNIVQCGSRTVIDDCYNANPVSMRAALELLAVSGGETAAILGDMGELGQEEARYHREIGALAAQKGICLLLCVGTLSRYLYEGACREKERLGQDMEIRYYETRDKLLSELKTADPFSERAVILVKASHSMGFSEIVKELQTLR